MKGILKWLSAAVLLSTVTAVGAQELRIAHQSAGETMDALAAAFEAANPGVTVKQITFSTADYENTGLITQLQSSQPPDIYFQWGGFPVQRDAKTGNALDITDYVTGAWKDSFSPAFFANGSGTTVDGRIYMIPTSADVHETVWYNKKIFADLKLTPPTTWKEFRTVVKAIAAAGITPIVIGNQDAWPLGNWVAQIASRTVPAAEYAAAFNQEAPFNTPAFQKAFGLVEDLHNLGAFNVDMASMDQDQGMATFFQGAAAMNPIGSWLVPTALDLADPDFDYSNFNTPIVEDGAGDANNVMGIASGYIVNAKTDKPDLAISFLKLMTSFESQRAAVERAPFISTVKGVLEGAKVDQHTIEMARLWNNATSMISAPDTSYPIPVAETFYRAAAYVSTGEKSAVEALAWLDDELAKMGKQTL